MKRSALLAYLIAFTAAGFCLWGIPSCGMAAGPKRTRSITPEQEAAAMAFAEQHHPELAQLLRSLKVGQHVEYQQAMHDLHRTSERLARIKNPKQYTLELKRWKIESRIHLLAAKSSMEDSDANRETLKKLIQERLEVRASLLQIEKERLERRLKKVESELGSIKDPEFAERELNRLIKDASRRAQVAKRKAARKKSTSLPSKGTKTSVTPSPNKPSQNPTSSTPERSKTRTAPQR